MLSVNRTGFPSDLLSPSSRRAWVEIVFRRHKEPVVEVALLAEGVGRNLDDVSQGEIEEVALLAEGVGRNKNFRKEIFKNLCRPPRGGRG